MALDEEVDLDEVYAALLDLEARTHRAAVTQLQAALASSRQIGVAIGIVMSQESLTRDDAFGLLVRTSRTSNRKLRDVAADVERRGRLTP